MTEQNPACPPEPEPAAPNAAGPSTATAFPAEPDAADNSTAAALPAEPDAADHSTAAAFPAEPDAADNSTAAAFPAEPGDGKIYVGQADLDAPGEQGWLLGHFRPADDPRHSAAVEIKWGRHPKGDRRAKWVHGEERTALLVLIRGRFHMEFPDRTVILTEPGHYVVWGRGVDHSWLAEEEDTVVLTVRWPSIAGYKVPPPK